MTRKALFLALITTTTIPPIRVLIIARKTVMEKATTFRSTETTTPLAVLALAETTPSTAVTAARIKRPKTIHSDGAAVIGSTIPANFRIMAKAAGGRCLWVSHTEELILDRYLQRSPS